jgi:hypothetical protein
MKYRGTNLEYRPNASVEEADNIRSRIGGRIAVILFIYKLCCLQNVR